MCGAPRFSLTAERSLPPSGGTATLVAAGRLSDGDALAFSAAGLAVSLSNVLGNSFVIGAASALDTFCGQAKGAGALRSLGVYLQRALALNLVIVCLLSALWAVSVRPLLASIEGDEALAASAWHFLALLAPGVFFTGCSECFRRYLQSQSIVRGPMWVTLVVALLHVPLTLAVVKAWGGYRGAALALSLSNGLLSLALWAYIRKQGDPRAWGGWMPREAMSRWPEFLRVAAPAAAMILLEWWAFEIAVIFAGTLPGDAEVNTGASAVLFNVVAIAFMLPYGVSAAAATRVGNALGAGDAEGARRAALATLALGGVIVVLVELVLVLTRHVIAEAFTANADVAAAVRLCLPWLCLEIGMDALQNVTTGALRGQGRQNRGALVNLCTYYAFALPLGLLLATRGGYGLRGLWAGLSFGALGQFLGQASLVWSADWEMIAMDARRRVEVEQAALTSDLLDGPQDALRGLLEGFANGDGVPSAPSAEAAANVGSDTMP